MDYEQRYKDTLDRARDMMSYKEVRREDMEYLFPELKEPEDERIRKQIISFLKEFEHDHYRSLNFSSWIAWLEKQTNKKDIHLLELKAKAYDDAKERMSYAYNQNRVPIGLINEIFPNIKLYEKQGEQKSVEDSLTLEEFENAFITKAKQYDIDLPNRSWDIYALCKELYLLKHKPKQGEKNPAEWHIEDEQNLNACLGYIPDELLRRWLKDIIHIKYDKSADKVEPKFHEGDWTVWKDKCYKVNYNGCGYELVDQNGLSTSLEYGTIDENAHLWDISKDAKDGDVLHSPSHHLIWIYKDSGQYYACVNMNYTTENINTNGLINIPNDVRPATKDEQTILFEKMKEANFKWDTDKKELIKL